RATVHGQPANDLLDQRDQLVAELNTLVRVNVSEDNGSLSLTIGNGQTLLSAGAVYPLRAVMSNSDPSRVAVAYTAADGAPIELADTFVDGGSLGGLLR